MALFEFEDAICQQVLQIVSRPLFPVTWRDMTGQDDEETPRLTALDVSGQIVSVEILKELDSETLITSLSRLAEVASISWSDLAAEYPSGPEGFRTGWAQFRDSMPPAVGPGPRLIMVAGDIDPSVRPALSVLATSGVEVHLMNLRQMSNGRLFLDVNAVGPRLYGHAPQLLASATAAPELAAATEQAAPLDDRAPAESAIPAPPEETVEASNDEDSETPTTRPTPKVAPHLREVFTYPMDEEPPAPFKPAAEEDAGGEGAEVVAESDESAELAVESDESEAEPVEDSEGAEAELADELSAADNHAEPDEAVDASQDEPQPGDEQDAVEEMADNSADVEDSEGVEAELADELLDHEDNTAQESAEAQEREAADERADNAADESDVDAHDDAEAPADEPRPEEAPEQADDQRADEPQADEQPAPEEDKPRWERPAHMSRRATRRAREESGELNDGGATDAATASFVDRAEESPEVAQARAEGLPVLGRNEAGLRTLAEILGQDTPLVARSELGLPTDLVLAANGAISGAGLTYPSLDTLLTARGLGHIDAWGQVRIGDRLGPTLAEALDEINREIVREYAQAPRGTHSAKH